MHEHLHSTNREFHIAGQMIQTVIQTVIQRIDSEVSFLADFFESMLHLRLESSQDR